MPTLCQLTTIIFRSSKKDLMAEIEKQ